MVKMTFTLDEETAAVLRRAGERLSKPQSMIVREAIQEYGARLGQLTHDERRRMLHSIDAFEASPSSRTRAAVDAELREIRTARRRGGRRSA